MSDTGSTPAPAGEQDELARAAAAGPPLVWEDKDGNSNLEAAESHDSPAAIDEERVVEPANPPDPMYSIYGEPAEQQRQERRD